MQFVRVLNTSDIALKDVSFVTPPETLETMTDRTPGIQKKSVLRINAVPCFHASMPACAAFAALSTRDRCGGALG
jgi:hypothetical protein